MSRTDEQIAQAQPPLCVNCRHYRQVGHPRLFSVIRCLRSAVEKVDPVTGRKYLHGAKFAWEERDSATVGCGYEGRLFEQKVTFWQRIFR